MKPIELVYYVKDVQIYFEFDKFGDIRKLYVNGTDKTDDGDAIDAALAGVADAGHNISDDISKALARRCHACGHAKDPMTAAKNHIELEMERGA